MFLRLGSGQRPEKVEELKFLYIMKNLSELGIQEMDAKEMKNTDGGGLVLAVCLTLVLLAACSQDAK
jgi:hypothetical protein